MKRRKLFYFNKIYIFVFFTGLFVIGVGCHNKSYKLKGEFNGFKKGQAAIQARNANRELTKLDSSEVENGRFSLSGKVTTPRLVYLSLRPNGPSTSFFLDNSVINIKGSVNTATSKFTDLKISGSSAQDEYEKMNKEIYSELEAREDSLKASIKQTTDKEAKQDLKAKLRETQSGFRQAVSHNRRTYIRNHPDSFIAPYALSFEVGYNQKNVKELTRLLHGLSDDVKHSIYYDQAKGKIQTLQKLQEGKDAPSFIVTSLGDDIITDASLKGKVYLIDFWASWCVPCVRTFPALKKIYADYHPKGFEIVTISIDRKRDNWLKGVKEHDLPWLNVATLYPPANKKQKLTEKFAVNHVPKPYLVGEDGKIVATEAKLPKIEAYLKKTYGKNTN